MIKLVFDKSVGLSDLAAKKAARRDITNLKHMENDTRILFGNRSYLREWQRAVLVGEVPESAVGVEGYYG